MESINRTSPPWASDAYVVKCADLTDFKSTIPKTSGALMIVKKAVIPAAGLEHDFSLPPRWSQELLPIVDKPSIQYIMEEVASAGIEEVDPDTGRERAPLGPL